MKRVLISSLFLFSTSVSASGYIDLGLGYTINTSYERSESCMLDYKEDEYKMGCSTSPLGYVAIGYEYKNFSVDASHWSSLRDVDYGMNMITVKYRFKLGGSDAK